jgi:hypothetical protein
MHAPASNWYRFLCFFVSFLIIAHTLNAQSMKKTAFPKAWQDIDELINKKGRYQDAQRKLEDLYLSAQLLKLPDQELKALIYQLSLMQELEEDADLAQIQKLRKQIQTAGDAPRAILYSLLAETYTRYYENEQYKINQRTPVAAGESDIQNWSATDFKTAIHASYRSSLQPEKILQSTPLSKYDSIIIKGNSRALRPTLYDLLAHRALDYFEQDPVRILTASKKEQTAAASVFDPYADFIRRKLGQIDTLDAYACSIQLFQKLLAFHEADQSPAALIDVDLRRYDYLRKKAPAANREKAYFLGVNHLAHQYGVQASAAPAWLALAQYHYQQGTGYQYSNPDETHRYELNKALDICKKFLPSSNQLDDKNNEFASLKYQIENPGLSFETESVVIPNKPIKALIKYRNIDTLGLALYAVDIETRKELINNQFAQSFWEKLGKMNPLRTWKEQLPQTADHQQHAVEVKIDGIAPGEYVLLIKKTNQEQFQSAQLVQSTHISLLQRDSSLYLLHRETGQPIAGAQVDISYKQYDSKQRIWIKRDLSKQQSNAAGEVKLSSYDQKNMLNQEIRISHQGETWEPRHSVYVSSQPSFYQRQTLKQTRLFTDRSIYRPGQILYCKGIVATIDPDNGRKSVLAGYKTKVVLLDANGEQIDSLPVTTNTYGSYHAQFVIPTGRLMGQYTLRDEQELTEVRFSVEAYKRPTFKVVIPNSTQSYSLQDQVDIQGTAIAYAGNPIQGATVQYLVKRIPRWQYPWWRQPHQNQGIVVLSTGNTTTDAQGQFKIQFRAEPDLSMPKEDYPLFTYQIQADVVDLQGEQHSASSTLTLGYQRFSLTTNIPNQAWIPADSLSKLQVFAQNFQGEHVETSASIQIQSIQQPLNPLRKRYWSAPDQFIISPADHTKYFPDDEYRSENDPDNWARMETVFKKQVRINVSGIEPVHTIPNNLPGGWYVLRVETKDSANQVIQYQQYIHIKGSQWHEAAPVQFSNLENLSPAGKSIPYQIETQIPVYLLQGIDRQYYAGAKSEQKPLSITKQGITQLEIPQENSPCALRLQHIYVWKNRIYEFQQNTLVQTLESPIQIETSYFRDKTEPGKTEQVRFTIKNQELKPEHAELLVSMYDASLDQFRQHQWVRPIWNGLWNGAQPWRSIGFESVNSQNRFNDWYDATTEKQYDQLMTLQNNIRVSHHTFQLRGVATMSSAKNRAAPQYDMVNSAPPKEVAAVENRQSAEPDLEAGKDPKNDAIGNPGKLRTDFRETAFFYPTLTTNEAGEISIQYEVPDALTTWKMQAIAHTKDYRTAIWQGNQIAQRELMVQPNLPRFLRQGDRMEIAAKLVNIGQTEITGQVSMTITDAITGENVDGVFNNLYRNQYFTVGAQQSTEQSFSIQVPHQYPNPVTITFEAAGNQLKDAEANTLPVLTHRSLITESLPLSMIGSGKKTFDFPALSTASEEKESVALTIEYTGNPAWLVVQALPYLQQYPFECSEQSFNRYVANRLSAHIAGQIKGLDGLLKKWKSDSVMSKSPLALNSALKQNILIETPWVADAKEEAQQRAELVNLLDTNQIKQSATSLLDRVQKLQNSDGGFCWFAGGPSQLYITQYIVSSIAHLQTLTKVPQKEAVVLAQMVEQAIPYLDREMLKVYQQIQTRKKTNTPRMVDPIIAHYLYARSFYDRPIADKKQKEAYAYFYRLAQENWTTANLYTQGLIALSLHQTKDTKTPSDIILSIKQKSFYSPDKGRYWKANSHGWGWHEAPIETQALLIELFAALKQNQTTIDEMRQWLIAQKETRHWPSTKSTAAACYALLLHGSNWLASTPKISIQVGNKKIIQTDDGVASALGYVQVRIPGSQVLPSMQQITIDIAPSNQDQNRPSYGAVYWQYLQATTEVGAAGKNLKVNRQLFKEIKTSTGLQLVKYEAGQSLQVGDRLVVRIEIQTDRALEFVHVKDSRSAATEPIDAISGYHWQTGIGYYENIRDTGTDFFLDYLPKGRTVFEYRLTVQQKGSLSAGITTVQCMYAPRFVANSTGNTLVVE